jgi:hypothetical protein
LSIAGNERQEKARNLFSLVREQGNLALLPVSMSDFFIEIPLDRVWLFCARERFSNFPLTRAPGVCPLTNETVVTLARAVFVDARPGTS